MKRTIIFAFALLFMAAAFGVMWAQETTPASPATETQPSTSDTPEITAVDPPRAARGTKVDMKISGKNFATGARVDFASQGISVERTEVVSADEIKARVNVAGFATLGTASVFVTNPNQKQAEAPFEVFESSAPQPETQTTTTTAPAGPASAPSPLQFKLIHNVGGLKLLNPKKPKGTLSVENGILQFEEKGKELLKAPLADVKEVEVNKVAGVATASFHVILKSGQRWDFYPSSLKRSECAFIAGALQNALKLSLQK